ncbi:MAG: serine hydrolase, partial [Gammaproteobacteria bacterium]
GLPSDLLNGMWADPPAPFTDVVHEVAEEYVANPPGTVLSYSNVGVTLLGHAIQNVSGQAFATHMQEMLLRPLGMNDSYFATALSPGPQVSKSYRNGEEEPEAPLRDIPAGGLNTNVLDLGRFMMMIFADGRAGSQMILQPATLAETLEPQNEHVALDFDLRVGLGWFYSGAVQNGGPVLGHDGSTGKFNSSLLMLPKHELGVVVLANSAWASAAVDLIATETLQHALEAKTGIVQPRGTKQATEPATVADLSAFAGHYVTPLGLAQVTDKGQHLDVEIDGKTFQLIPRSDGRLRLSKRALGLIPLRLGRLGRAGLSRAVVGGREVLTARFGGKDTLLGEKIKPVPVSPVWRARAGEYEITNLRSAGFTPEKIEVYYEEDGFMIVVFDMAEYGDRAAIPIAPVTDTEAIILGLGRGKGETISVVSTADGEVMRYSGFLLKKKEQAAKDGGRD